MQLELKEEFQLKNNKMPDLKEEVISILKPLFGDSVVNIVKDYYESDNPQELVNLTHKMLSDFMGENNADALIENILKKFPKLKVKA